MSIYELYKELLNQLGLDISRQYKIIDNVIIYYENVETHGEPVYEPYEINEITEEQSIVIQKFLEVEKLIKEMSE